jgi:hypothetical protein
VRRIGHTRWAIAEGHIPGASTGPAPDNEEPEPVARDKDYASVIESDVPIVVQHSRLDSRQAELGLLTTVAFAAD